jgi:hypothetical protein
MVLGGLAPIRPRHLVPTQQGVGTLAPNDLTPCQMAFYFVSTFAIAQTPPNPRKLALAGVEARLIMISAVKVSFFIYISYFKVKKLKFPSFH